MIFLNEIIEIYKIKQNWTKILIIEWSLLNGVPNVPYVPYVPTCPSIFYRPENLKMEILYPYFFKGTGFNFGP